MAVRFQSLYALPPGGIPGLPLSKSQAGYHRAQQRMKRQFEYIYAHDVWGNGSGEGSLEIHTRPYVRFLQGFLRDRAIASVVDFGCGDWQFSQTIDWSGIDYRGFDIVPSVILANRAKYQKANIIFHEIEPPYNALPEADLLIVKDVLQHWSDESVFAFLPVLARYRYALVTNCVNPAGSTKNLPIEDAGFRYLDIRLPPFNLAAREVLSFANHRGLRERLFEKPRWLKKVLLVENIGR
ncbi:MAG TPA: methyltransferase [Rhizomicrobium sp.]|jgi:SAM-dependent methyltransferase